jgi:hypothetical protein
MRVKEPGKGSEVFWEQRSTKLTGMTLLFLAVVVIIDIVLEAAILGESNGLARGDTEAIISDIYDNEGVFLAGSAIAVVSDGIALIATAALLWLLLRDRSPVLATLGLVGLVGASAAFIVSDAGYVTTYLLAADFVEEGGPAGVPAGDPATLQSARTVIAFSTLADLFGLITLAAGTISYASIVAWAPVGAANPPRWLGVIGAASASVMSLIWMVTLQEDVGFMLGGIGILGTLMFISILGGWLLSQPGQDTAPASGRQLPEAI